MPSVGVVCRTPARTVNAVVEILALQEHLARRVEHFGKGLKPAAHAVNLSPEQILGEHRRNAALTTEPAGRFLLTSFVRNDNAPPTWNRLPRDLLRLRHTARDVDTS